MNAHDTLRVVAWLVRDTFRRGLESRVFWMMLGLSAVAVATCLSVRVSEAAPLIREGERPDFLPRGDRDAVPEKVRKDGVDIASAELTLGFGAFRIPLARDAAEGVRTIQVVLAAGVADTAGILLALVWTAGFLPGFLAPRSASVLLAKPVGRRVLFLGQFAGVLVFVAFQAAVLVGGTWLALGARTGVWSPRYLLCVPLLLLQFTVFFTVSALIAAHLRGTAACILGSVLFWGLCWGMNYGRHAAVALPTLAPKAGEIGRGLGLAVEAGYWALPKPADLGMILGDALGAAPDRSVVPEFAAVRDLHRFHPLAALLSSTATAAALLAWAVRRFELADY
ncbi:MAG: transcriptional regulator [Thermoleophilia bacterium]|nr:transcriptional regulator [Thermoleophilia bacterium]